MQTRSHTSTFDTENRSQASAKLLSSPHQIQCAQIQRTLKTLSQEFTTMLNDPLGFKALGKVVDFVKEYTEKPEVANDISNLTTQVVDRLSNTPGMTQAQGTDFKRDTPKFKLKDGTIIKTFKNPLGVDYIFLADSRGRMIFGGYVGWIHSENLKQTVAEIKRTFV